MSSVIQRSFSGGELDPVLWPRTDTTKYQTGARLLRNFYVRRNGGVLPKPGSTMIASVKNSAVVTRLIPFIYNQSTTYMLELGDKYIRFYQNGLQVQAQGATAYNNGTSYGLGNLVTSAGTTYYCVYNGGSTSVLNFDFNPTLLGLTASSTSGHAPGALGVWYPLNNTIYEIPTPWANADLPLLKFDQSANDIVFTHPSYPPMRLTRLAGGLGNPDIFQLFSVLLGSYMLPAQPTNNGASPNTFIPGASGVITYAVAAVSAAGDERAMFAATVAVGVDLTTTKTVGSSGSPLELGWSSVANAVSYNIYRRHDPTGVYGFLGNTPFLVFFDDGSLTPDFANPWVQDVGQTFGSTNNYPTAVAFYQQRLMYANSNLAPTKTWGSQTGLYDCFNINVPTLATDSLSFKMVGQQDVVEHLLYLGVLLVFTYGTINSVQGDQNGALSPASINPHRETVHGSSTLRPLIVGEFVVYNQSQGSIVRDLGFNFQVDGYRGDDLTVFATHLFDNYTLVDWCYQAIPNSVIWAVRSDGTLLSMTYVREQQILAWAHHDTTAGFYTNVAAIPEGNTVSVYVIASRTINGTTFKYVERFFSQQYTDVRNYIGMDCATTIDGRNTSTDTVTISGGTLWNETELLTLTLSANNFTTFQSSDATNGTFIFIYDAGGNLVRFKITVYSSGTVVQGFVDRTVPVDLQGVATAVWSYTYQQLTGLSYLNGQNVAVFADGCVVGSPNNPAYPVYTMTAGVITLDKHYAVIQVGLPITSDLETLDIDTPGAMDNLAGKFKLVGEVTLSMVNSRSVFVGGQNPDTDLTNSPYSAVYRLTEQKLRQNEGYDLPMALQTGKITQNIQGDWDQNGHVFIRNVDPSPCLIAAVSPEGLYPMGKV